MGKNHLIRLAAPKIWQIDRKKTKFITKPVPGPHGMQSGMPVNTVLKEILNYAATTKEVKKILNTNEVKIDGVARKDFRFPVGVFDTLEFPSINEQFRILLNKIGHLDLIKIKKEEASVKPSKIVGKTMVNGKLQLNLYDGKNILVNSGNYNIGDSVLLSLPDQKITKHLKLDKKASIFLVGGKHTGEIGHVEDIIQNKIIYKDQKGNLVETSKEYAFVVGDSKPLITLENFE